MKELLLLSVLGLVIVLGCTRSEPPTAHVPSKAGVNSVLDDWHNASAEADFHRYFDHFAGDSAIFMGTDATERWTIAEFKPWSKPYFDRGEAWNFTPVERHIYFSEHGKTAWLDESLDTPNLGPGRGSGVLVWQDSTWEITHYNLSIPIPNAIVEDVVDQIEKVNENE